MKFTPAFCLIADNPAVTRLTNQSLWRMTVSLAAFTDQAIQQSGRR
jgi:hypothetical protein